MDDMFPGKGLYQSGTIPFVREPPLVWKDRYETKPQICSRSPIIGHGGQSNVNHDRKGGQHEERKKPKKDHET